MALRVLHPMRDHLFSAQFCQNASLDDPKCALVRGYHHVRPLLSPMLFVAHRHKGVVVGGVVGDRPGNGSLAAARLLAFRAFESQARLGHV